MVSLRKTDAACKCDDQADRSIALFKAARFESKGSKPFGGNAARSGLLRLTLHRSSTPDGPAY